MTQASVQSIDAVRDFRAALCTFAESATSAMASTTLESQRFVDWLEHDQVKHWTQELRRREEQVTEAKSALNRKRIAATFGDPPRDSEEQALLKKALRRLEEAQDKIKKLAKWRGLVERAVTEYTGQAQQMTNYLEGDLPKAIALFERLIDRLEEYAGIVRPSAAEAGSSQPSFAQPTSPKAEEAKPVETKTEPAASSSDAPAADSPSGEASATGEAPASDGGQ